MYELTLINKDGCAYVDSRDVAALIGKQHKHLLRDIREYSKTIAKFNRPNFGPVNFFLESSYPDSKHKDRSCYLITKMGCEVIRNKLRGEKGVLFTTLYVSKFNEMENALRAETEAQLARAATPHLKVFNTAVRNVLAGYANAKSNPDDVMGFLRGAYKPFGIEVVRASRKHYLTATDIAALSGLLSDSGRPHAHAAASIIGKLKIAPEHFVIVPYGAAGISMRYDSQVLGEVRHWIYINGLPRDIPHHWFEYHVHYDPEWMFLYDGSSGDYYFDCDDYGFIGYGSETLHLTTQ